MYKRLVCEKAVPRKKTIEEVRSAFEEIGYLVVSSTYTNNTTPIEFICDKGHHTFIKWRDFNEGCRCSECFGSKKYDIEYVRSYLYSFGYDLQSDAYVNNNSPLECVCCNGHPIKISFDSFIQGKRCKKCYHARLAASRRFSLDYVISVFSGSGYEYVSGVYKNCMSRLTVVCPAGHVYDTTFTNFKSGYRCRKCSGFKKKTLEEICISMGAEEYTLVSTKYFGNKSGLLAVCPKGHVISIKWRDFQDGCRCSLCSSSGPRSRVSQKWLDILGVPQKNREVYFPELGIRVDAYAPETNTVYEFLGDYWHGNPDRFDQDVIHPAVKKTFGQLFDETVERLFLLRQSGYNLNVIWEKDFKLAEE